MDKNLKSERFEDCVICGTKTDVAFYTPVDFRENYIVGCGQLCNKCYDNFIDVNEKQKMLSHNQLVYLLKRSKNQ